MSDDNIMQSAMQLRNRSQWILWKRKLTRNVSFYFTLANAILSTLLVSSFIIQTYIPRQIMIVLTEIIMISFSGWLLVLYILCADHPYVIQTA